MSNECIFPRSLLEMQINAEEKISLSGGLSQRIHLKMFPFLVNIFKPVI